MTLDPILENAASNSHDKTLWGKYEQHYDWEWHKVPVIIPKEMNVSGGIFIRDWSIAKELKKLGVKKVLDVGSDTGHFMAVLKYHGIDAVGVDADKIACETVFLKGVNKSYPIGIQTLITLNLEGYDCISCMNITQAKWVNEDLKNDFIAWIQKNFTYAVLTDISHQDRKWLGLKKIYDFNMLPFYCSRAIIKVAQKLGIEKIISYPNTQKIYKTLKHP